MAERIPNEEKPDQSINRDFETRGTAQSFELTTILMVLLGDNLGESHVAHKVNQLLTHLLGQDAFPIEGQSTMQDKVQIAAAIIMQQHPQLEELVHHLRSMPINSNKDELVRELSKVQLDLTTTK